MSNLLSAGPRFTLVERINRSAKSNTGLFVPRRGEEETCGAIVYDAGKEGTKEGIKNGDLIIVRPHCGFDFTLNDPIRGKVSLTALAMDNDEMFAIAPQGTDLDKRDH
jgi:co-chaperonin GroES (HSP10)